MSTWADRARKSPSATSAVASVSGSSKTNSPIPGGIPTALVGGGGGKGCGLGQPANTKNNGSTTMSYAGGGGTPPPAALRLPSPTTPPPPIIDYYKLQNGHLLTLPTESLGTVMEFLPMGDVARASRCCRRLNAVCDIDFVWQFQLNGLKIQLESSGFPFAELPRHFYMRGKDSPLPGQIDVVVDPTSQLSNSSKTTTGGYCEAKKKVMAHVRFHQHDMRRAVLLPELQQEFIHGRGFTFRKLDAPVKPEHERFLLMSLTTSGYTKTDEPVSRLMSAMTHWSSGVFDEGDVEQKMRFGLYDTTETEDPLFLHQLLVGISPLAPASQNSSLHFGRRARLIEINYSLASDLLAHYAMPHMKEVFQTFNFDSRVTRYFTGPELCSHEYIGLVVVDPLRVMLVRERSREWNPAPGQVGYRQAVVSYEDSEQQLQELNQH